MTLLEFRNKRSNNRWVDTICKWFITKIWIPQKFPQYTTLFSISKYRKSHLAGIIDHSLPSIFQILIKFECFFFIYITIVFMIQSYYDERKRFNSSYLLNGESCMWVTISSEYSDLFWNVGDSVWDPFLIRYSKFQPQTQFVTLEYIITQMIFQCLRDTIYAQMGRFKLTCRLNSSPSANR